MRIASEDRPTRLVSAISPTGGQQALVGRHCALGWVSVLALVVGCARGGGSDAGAEGMQVRTSTGIHLAVPAGWSTAPGADGSLRVASAPGHVVLRAELRRHVGMPSAEALRSGFTSGLKRLRLRHETRVESPGFLALRFAVGPAVDSGPEEEVFLSATALGDDTLLCNSLRGTSSADLEVLLRACREAGGPDAGS